EDQELDVARHHLAGLLWPQARLQPGQIVGELARYGHLIARPRARVVEHAVASRKTAGAPGRALEAAGPRPHALATNVERRLVCEVRVVAVQPVLDLKLPVAGVRVLLHPGSHLDLAVGGPIDAEVDVLRGLAQVLLQRLARRAQAGEDEAAVAG